ncbi:sugar ABC transporter ATP-binding protein [Oleiharenicola lentus]|uniref:sugar ABC transporter ATP-binding protein n=1 Tax=Oleiharenicola lentus TaxID=2508720 RepID=UPI003F681217
MSFIEFTHITKRFPGVVALGGVSFGIERGTCHALIGENGAGKSTLGKILAGVQTADGGEIRLDGKVIAPDSPLAARELGIAMVHQELAFCPNLSVAENLCLGDLPRRGGFVDRPALREKARVMLATIGADAFIDPDTIIGTLSTGREQLVQIAAAVGTGAKVIVMDEPSSSLSAAETAELFRLVRELKARGITLIYVSHRLEELFALCDNITVLRDGHHVATERIADTTPQRVVTQMIGRELLIATPNHLAKALGEERLRVEALSSPGKFSNVTLSVRAGEIVGVAGIVGAGRSEVVEAIFGLDANARGQVSIKQRPLPLGSLSAALAAGVGLVPEDRKRQGLVLGLNCRENTSLAALPLLTKLGWVNRSAEHTLTQRYAQRLRVKAPSLESITAGLSGGNQQKIALAKWLARSCDVLLIDEPTRGVDVGAKAEIYQILDELACEGKALLVVSSELPELIGLCRRILVMRNGAIAGEVQRAEFTEAALMQLMAGVAAA